MKTRYTAQEMREAAEVVLEFVNGDEDFVVSLASMLRQAADMMERAEGLIAALEYRHKGADAVLAAANYITKGVRP